MGGEQVEPVDLFEFLRLLEVAGHRGALTRMQERVARLAALDSDGTSGTGVVVNTARIAVELGLSERQVWRHFHAVRKAGFFVQTEKAARGFDGPGSGRKARYRCMAPALNLMGDRDLGMTPEAEDVSYQDGDLGMTQDGEELSCQDGPADSWHDTFGPLGMTSPGGEMSQSYTTDLQPMADVGDQPQDSAREQDEIDSSSKAELIAATRRRLRGAS